MTYGAALARLLLLVLLPQKMRSPRRCIGLRPSLKGGASGHWAACSWDAKGVAVIFAEACFGAARHRFDGVSSSSRRVCMTLASQNIPADGNM